MFTQVFTFAQTRLAFECANEHSDSTYNILKKAMNDSRLTPDHQKLEQAIETVNRRMNKDLALVSVFETLHEARDRLSVPLSLSSTQIAEIRTNVYQHSATVDSAVRESLLQKLNSFTAV